MRADIRKSKQKQTKRKRHVLNTILFLHLLLRAQFLSLIRLVPVAGVLAGVLAWGSVRVLGEGRHQRQKDDRGTKIYPFDFFFYCSSFSPRPPSPPLLLPSSPPKFIYVPTYL